VKHLLLFNIDLRIYGVMAASIVNEFLCFIVNNFGIIAMTPARPGCEEKLEKGYIS